MHSDMDTKDKLNIINEMLPKGERLIASVGGHIIPPRENDFIYNAFSTMVTQEWGNSNQPLGVHSNLVKNVYMGLTENNVYVAVLNTYHPDIVQAKLTVPQSEISWDYAKRGFRNIITLPVAMRAPTLFPAPKPLLYWLNTYCSLKP